MTAKSKGSTDDPAGGVAPSSAPLRVAIVEDQTAIREGLGALIGGTPGFACVGRFASVEEALGGLPRMTPRVVLIDINLPGLDGIEGIRRLKPLCPEAVFLVLSVYDDEDRIFRALCAGASGYLLKKTPPSRLLEALAEAAQGGGPLSPEVAQRVIRLFREVAPQRPETELTPHEQRILRLLADGHDYPSAAGVLGVATSTVVYHMRNIFTKLEVHSKSEAVAKALRSGLLR